MMEVMEPASVPGFLLVFNHCCCVMNVLVGELGSHSLHLSFNIVIAPAWNTYDADLE